MIVRFNLKRLIISLLIPLAAGGISALITRGDMDLYKTVNRPPLSPPGIVFQIVWTVLYILMGVSLYLIWNNGDNYSDKTAGYVIFAIQLFPRQNGRSSSDSVGCEAKAGSWDAAATGAAAGAAAG